MFTFLQYVCEAWATPKFYTLRLVESTIIGKTIDMLRKYRIPSSYKPPPDKKYHCSVITSGTEVSNYHVDKSPIELTPSEWALWPGQFGTTLVLVCDQHPRLTSQLEHAINAGAELTRPIHQYNPHVSFLISPLNGEAAKFRLADLPVPKFKIRLHGEEVTKWNPPH